MQKQKTKNCQNCEVIYTGHPNSKFCSTNCYDQNLLKTKIKPDPTKVSCKVCGIYSHQLSSHIKTHNLTAEQYKNIYNSPLCSQTYLENSSKRIKGDKNPGYNHNGKLSPFSKKFVKYQNLDDDEKNKVISEMAYEAQIKSKENGNLAVTKEYFIKRGASEEEATKLLKERQTTFNKDICIQKYGIEEGIKRWSQRQEKWQNNLKCKPEDEIKRINRLKTSSSGNISKAEKEIFKSLNNIIDDIETQYIINKNKGYVFDIRVGNKLIEYNGDYWHCNPSIYPSNFYNKTVQKTAEDIWKKDNAKYSFAKENGYDVLVIWEKDYKQNPEKIIKECLNYLTQ